jgi:DNA polymerase/3'-5' exonuclease PolX
MSDSEESLGELLKTSDFPTLIAIGEALLNLTVNSKLGGVLDLEAPYAPDQALPFKPSDIPRFTNVVQVLRDHLPEPAWFGKEKLKGLKKSDVVKAWKLLINAFLSHKIMQVAVLRQSQGDTNSANAHKKGSVIIASLEYPIESGKQAQSIKGIGPKMAAKIDELLTTGKLKELQEVEDKQTIIKLFSFWGSNTTTATVWYNKGYRTIADLVAADEAGEITFTTLQALAIRHLEDFDVPLTLEDAQHIVKLVRASVPAGFEVILAGSFRRGKKVSKDCDIVVIGEKANETTGEIWVALEDVAEIEVGAQGRDVIMGVIKMPSGVWKRFDVFVSSKSERACSLLAHTGPALYNVKLRAAAKEKGWLLNEKHLTDDEGDIIDTPTEADVQIQLGFPVQTPEERK